MPIETTLIMQTTIPSDGTLRFSTGCSNPGCRAALPPLKDIATDYFENRSIPCSECGIGNDIWQLMRNSARENAEGVFDLIGLGAASTTIIFPLSPRQIHEVYFPDCGIPEDAVILDIQCTGNGSGNSCIPIEMKMPFSPARFAGSKISFYGMPIGDGSENTTVWGSVTWVHEQDDSEPWLLLADAYESVLARKFSRVLGPAHSAFEISLNRLIKETLQKHASREKVKSFMIDALTADNAMNVMLPFLCAHWGVRPLPEDIVSVLNQLRSKRNKVVHDGLSDAEVSGSDAREFLCAAVFGFEFVRSVKRRLAEREQQASQT